MDENKVYVPTNKFVEMIKNSEKLEILKNAFFGSLKKTQYGDTFREGNVLAVFQSVFPDEYSKWSTENGIEED